MTKKTAVPSQLTSQEVQLIEQLRQNPEIMARVQSILDITRNAEGPLKSADEVEGLLMQEMIPAPSRLLGIPSSESNLPPWK